jgi:hypothetical protein
MNTITIPNDHPNDSISFDVMPSLATSYDSTTNPLENMLSYERVDFVRVPVYHRIANTEFKSYRWVPRDIFIDIVKLIDGSIYIREIDSDFLKVPDDYKVVCDENDEPINDMSLPKELFEL